MKHSLPRRLGSACRFAAALTLCSCTTYVLPDGKVVASGLKPVRPTVTPYNTGYLNPWGFGTSGAYGGGYYPVYSGAWGNFNGWNSRGSGWKSACN